MKSMRTHACTFWSVHLYDIYYQNQTHIIIDHKQKYNYQVIDMSLFIGNVPKQVTQKQLEDVFKPFGKCKIDLRLKFAFVQFQSQRNAEQSKKQLQNTNFRGAKLNVEWSKNSGRFNENNRAKNQRDGRRRRSRSRDDRNWRRDDQRWGRRSPSYQKRGAPDYSENQRFQNFVPLCPRDQELLKRVKVKYQKKRVQIQMVEQKEQNKEVKDQMQNLGLQEGERLE